MGSIFIKLCLGIDPSAGRFNTSMLSDQAMLELLVEGFRADSHYRFKFNDSFMEFRHWDIVKAFEGNTVLSLKLAPKIPEDEIFSSEQEMLYGVFETKFVPRQVRTLVITGCGFTGTVDFSSLPASIMTLTIIRTPFEGSLDAKTLPGGLQCLSITSTKLSGSIEFSDLPRTLEKCILARCAFTGSVILEALPAKLHVLDLQANTFTEGIDLRRLPGELRELNLSENGLSGSVCLRELPQSLQKLDLGDNRLTGELNNEILDNLPASLRYLGIYSNYFSGSIDLTRCHANLDVCEHKDLPAHRKVDELFNYDLAVTTWESTDFFEEW